MGCDAQLKVWSQCLGMAFEVGWILGFKGLEGWGLEC